MVEKNQPISTEVISIRPTTTYRKRRDLMLKKFPMQKIIGQLSEVVRRKCLVIIYDKGRPCEIRKEKLITFILIARINRKGYETMEMESELYLKRHYDHSAFQYHYSNLGENTIYTLTELLRDKIYSLINEIYLHIFDSTALSTSVRAERTRQGIRKKEKLTDKFHTLLGYDPPIPDNCCRRDANDRPSYFRRQRRRNPAATNKNQRLWIWRFQIWNI